MTNQLHGASRIPIIFLGKAPRQFIEFFRAQAEQFLEKVEVGKDHGEVLAVIIPIVIIDQLVIEVDLSGFGDIQAGQ